MSEVRGSYEVSVLVPVAFLVDAFDADGARKAALNTQLIVAANAAVRSASVGFPEAIRVKEIEEVTG